MQPLQSTIERAFELARTRQCRTIDDIRRKLTSEGYEAASQHLSGATIRRQLQAVINTAEGGSEINEQPRVRP
ncbi:hypothetical protein EAH79_11435 [Sphingomonas koreensis]|nr:hypothetical protein EAH79_11435 [Sphingomonas koreensis]